MKITTLVAGSVLLAAASFALGQETGKSLAASYESLADVILGAKKTEANLVRAILDEHRGRAAAAMAKGDSMGAGAQMALFANEGDNAVGGVRKRLLEGGHHHHADDEAKGIYEAGYVVVTRTAKKECMEASMAMQKSTDDAGRHAAWDRFERAAGEVLK